MMKIFIDDGIFFLVGLIHDLPLYPTKRLKITGIGGIHGWGNEEFIRNTRYTLWNKKNTLMLTLYYLAKVKASCNLVN